MIDEDDKLFEDWHSRRTQKIWQSSALGLESFISFLRARLLFLVLGHCLVLVAAALHSSSLQRAIAAGIPVASAILAFGMCSGIFRYRRVPPDHGGTSFAWLAIVFFALSGLGEMYTAILALRSMGIGLVPPAADAALKNVFGATWAIRYAMGVSEVLALVGLVCLMASFRSLARSLGESDFRRRATRTIVIVAVAIGMAAALRYADARALIRRDFIVGAAFPVIGFVLFAIARALGVARLIQSYQRALAAERETDAPLPLEAWRKA